MRNRLCRRCLIRRRFVLALGRRFWCRFCRGNVLSVRLLSRVVTAGVSRIGLVLLVAVYVGLMNVLLGLLLL